MCRHKNIWRAGIVAFALAMLGIVAAGSAQAAGQLVAEGGLGGRMETKEHDVRVVINNGVAVTEVEQVFVNKENRVVEALYTFPVPKNASVANFSMWINGKEMIGEVLEKEKAREIYNSYKQVRRDPGLLEQINFKRFEMRIFPIPAGGEQRVRVTYYQELDVDHDWATYTYPLATAVDGRPVDERTTGRFSFTLEAKSESPIVGMESPSHGDDFVFVQHDEYYKQASLEVDGGDLSRDLVLAYHLQRPQSGFDLIASRQKGEDGYFLMTITAGKELEEQNAGMDYVFVLDISGSMANDGKLGTSRQSIEAFMEALGPEDRFEVLSFNLAPTPLFRELRGADEEAQQTAGQFLMAQQARGGTVLRPALQTAYKYRDADRQLNVVVLSDGMTEPTEQSELLQLIAARPSGVRVFCIGVGNEVNRPLLRQMAEQAGGLAAFISRGDDFQRQAKSFRRKLLRPAMANLQLQFGGVDVYDVEPQRLPDLYHGSPVRIYGRYRGGGPLTVNFAADVLGKPIEDAFETDLPQADPGNPEIERTWAWHRVQCLLNEERSSGNAGMLKEKIVQLCEDYSIASEYASFLVLENDAEYKRWAIERKNAVRLGRDRAARDARRDELRQLRDRALANLAPQTSEGGDRAPAADQLAAASPKPSPIMPNGPPAPMSAPRSGRNFDIGGGGGGGGGGAIDPLSGVVLLTLAGLGARRARRIRRRTKS